jgi:hypothetical protein
MAEPTSLFGPSALEARRASDLDFEQRTRTQAQLDPMALNYASRINSARSIGRGINSLLGGQSTDPELRRAEIMDSVFKTLSPEELKNPAKALSTIADALEEQGLPRDAAEARMKSISAAQQMSANENKVIESNIKANQLKLENVAQAANSALTVFQNAPDNLDMQEAVYKKFVDVQERLFGTEEADKLRAVKPSDRKILLESAIDAADKEGTRAKKDIADARIASAQKITELKEGNRKAEFEQKETNKFILQANDLNFRGTKAYMDNLTDRVSNVDKEIKEQSDRLEMYSDPMKSPTLSATDRQLAINVINQNIANLQKSRASLTVLESQAGRTIQSPVVNRPAASVGGQPPAPSATKAVTPVAGTDADYQTNFTNVQNALSKPGANVPALLAAFKSMYPNAAQPVAGAQAKPAAPAAQPQAAQTQPEPVAPKRKLTAKEQKEADFEAAFLAELGAQSDMQIIGKAAKKAIAPIVKYISESKTDMQIAFDNQQKKYDLVDDFADYAKKKLKDKEFVDNLTPEAKIKLQELADNTRLKIQADAEDGASTVLTLGSLAVGAGIAGVTVRGLLKVGVAKAAKSAAKKEMDSIPSSAPAMEQNMAQLKQTLLRLSEGERIAKLRSLGYKAEESANLLVKMGINKRARSAVKEAPERPYDISQLFN